MSSCMYKTAGRRVYRFDQRTRHTDWRRKDEKNQDKPFYLDLWTVVDEGVKGRGVKKKKKKKSQGQRGDGSSFLFILRNYATKVTG